MDLPIGFTEADMEGVTALMFLKTVNQPMCSHSQFIAQVMDLHERITFLTPPQSPQLLTETPPTAAKTPLMPIAKSPFIPIAQSPFRPFRKSTSTPVAKYYPLTLIDSPSRLILSSPFELRSPFESSPSTPDQSEALDLTILTTPTSPASQEQSDPVKIDFFLAFGLAPTIGPHQYKKEKPLKPRRSRSGRIVKAPTRFVPQTKSTARRTPNSKSGNSMDFSNSMNSSSLQMQNEDK